MDEDILCGLNAVSAVFRARPAAVRRLYYTQAARHLAGPFCAELAQTRRPYRELPEAEMVRAAGTSHHGGIVAVAEARKLPILDRANPPIAPFLLVLDGVSNPHNLGAIARSAVFFGVRELVIHEVPGAAYPSPAAYRTSEGALEFLNIHRTRDLPTALREMDRHYRTVATALGTTARPLAELPRDRPVALVLGHEEHGVSPAVRAACRREIRIEPRGPMQSLNVAQAAAIFLHELALPLVPPGLARG